ncbi:MAG TPA: sensor domain-containing diguanylate cyclase, partial [Methylophilaceae bacterium]|nr:sensor domain-containing diguanylate cyclase [Methylophilaceae bacterium]
MKPYESIKSHIQLDLFPSGHLVTEGIGRASERFVVYANPYLCELVGRNPEELEGKQLGEVFTKASAIMIETYLIPMLLKDETVLEMQLDLRLASGEKQPVVVNAKRSPYDRELIYWSLFSATQRNQLYQELILARRAIEEKAQQFEKLASTDSMTGLLNRRELIRRTEILLSYQRRSSRPVSIIVLDIDHFKKINDRYGHQKGDEIIKAVANVFKS